jgi:hypothetical protein
LAILEKKQGAMLSRYINSDLADQIARQRDITQAFIKGVGIGVDIGKREAVKERRKPKSRHRAGKVNA